MQFNEIPEALRSNSIFKGSYPEIVKTGYNHYLDWYSSYLETFVLRDVKSLINIGNLRDFRQFLALLAANSAQVLNMSEVSRTLGIPVSTIKRWISVLEASYIIFLLPSFHFNLGKRIIKSPKLYFYDTGLVCFLTNITNKELYENGPMAGSLFENFIIADLKKNSIHKNLMNQMYYYRTSNGVEIDLVIDSPDGKSWIEIKKSHTFRTRMLSAVEKNLSDHDKGFLVYEGDNFPYKKDIKILNYTEVLTGHFFNNKT
jgi:predicted AAA+ superfamily ATPase